MKNYTVRYYVATAWSFLTQADHFEEVTIRSASDIKTLAKMLGQEGFGVSGKWIMPGAILSIEESK